MNIIENLESFQQKLVGFEMYGFASELHEIIDEIKKEMKEPTGYMYYMDGRILGEYGIRLTKEYADHDFKKCFCRSNGEPIRDAKTIPLFSNPPLSDETVKDGYVMVPVEPTEDMEYAGNEIADKLAVTLNSVEYMHDQDTANKVYKAMIGEAMKAAK